MRKPNHFPRHLLLFAALSPLAGCGSFAPDDERYDRLDKLRVLAIQSESADIAPGETSTLTANIYEPEDRDVSYRWSWCPSRADSTEGFACAIDEKTLQKAWQSLGSDGAPPSYDLGTEPEAHFTHMLTPELVVALCQTILDSDALDEQGALACFMGLQASVQLTVRTSKDEVTAIRNLSLLMSETPASERNVNPPSNFSVRLRDKETDTVVDDGETLRAGHSYKVTAKLNEEIAQTFTPASEANGEAEPRRETLIMSWFITMGKIVPPVDDVGFGEGDVRSTFVDGRNDFEDMTQNGWQLPLTAGSTAELHLVLRDERGGVGWTRQIFDVTGGQK